MPAPAQSRRAKAAPRKAAAASLKPSAPPRDAAEFAKQQIERLEAMLQSLMAMANGGELGAIDRILKILDRLDRYRGYSPAGLEEPEEDMRERILRKLSEVDARRAAAKGDDAEAANDASIGA